MSNKAKAAPEAAKWYVAAYKKVSPFAIKLIDRVLQLAALVFIVGTSFLYVRNWLHANQINYDYSLMGAILVLSVALYLVVRKR